MFFNNNVAVYYFFIILAKMKSVLFFKISHVLKNILNAFVIIIGDMPTASVSEMCLKC